MAVTPVSPPMSPDDDPSTFIPFKSGVGHYDANVAKAFFKKFGKVETFAGGVLVFAENEQSNKQSIFKKSVSKALTTPLDQSLFAKKNVHRMYFLTEGEVLLSAEGVLEETARAGDVFGEMAVLSEIPDIDTPARRTATATAASNIKCISLDGDEVQAGLASQPEFALMLMSVMFDRLRAQVIRFSVRADDAKHRANRLPAIFGKNIVDALRDSLGHASVVRFNEGAKIMKEGNPGTTMYVVFEGEVAVAVGRRIVEKVGPGGVFGEMALVDQMPRAASAVARTDCALLSMNRDQLITLVKSNPGVGMAMMRAVAERLRYMNSILA
jgi:CRP/FNR family transcriptional regulator, cyclic AMP receptor protein